MTLEARLRVAKEAIRTVENHIQEARSTMQIDFKADGSPVTNLDRDAELIITTRIEANFPQDAIRAEEGGSKPGKNEYQWVVDAIDGTWPLINGEFTYATSIAIKRGEQTVAAFVNNPALAQLFVAAEQRETTLNEKPLPLYNQTDPKNAVYDICVDPSRREVSAAFSGLCAIREIGKVTSKQGSVVLNLAHVARGTHSVYIRVAPPLEAWDTRAGEYLVRSVGGRVGFFNQGRTLIAATNPQIYQATIKMLKQNCMGCLLESK